jgi:cytochrome c
MFSYRSAGACLALAALAACTTSAPTTSRADAAFGRAASAQEVAAWDISIPPSGEGLPAGSGNAKQGEAVYAAKCEGCHGAKGAGKPADPLAGGLGSLASANPVRTVGSYWPYATTLFDYTRRAMPVTNPQSLTNDEVYAVTAYLLYLNGIVAESDEMNARALPQVKMPNREGFVDWSRK